jgi:hypothetical protein
MSGWVMEELDHELIKDLRAIKVGEMPCTGLCSPACLLLSTRSLCLTGMLQAPAH